MFTNSVERPYCQFSIFMAEGVESVSPLAASVESVPPAQRATTTTLNPNRRLRGCQGLTFKQVRMLPFKTLYAHGQFYVLLSRVADTRSIRSARPIHHTLPTCVKTSLVRPAPTPSV